MAQQKITVKIAGRPYVLNASSEEHERKIRVSADEINKKVNAYLDKFPGKSIVDILSFVALNVCMNNLTLQEQIKNLSDEEKAKLQHLPVCLEDALDALEADYAFLTEGGVFPEELIKNFIKAKREERSQLSAIPHLAELDKYYNL